MLRRRESQYWKDHKPFSQLISLRWGLNQHPYIYGSYQRETMDKSHPPPPRKVTLFSDIGEILKHLHHRCLYEYIKPILQIANWVWYLTPKALPHSFFHTLHQLFIRLQQIGTGSSIKSLESPAALVAQSSLCYGVLFFPICDVVIFAPTKNRKYLEKFSEISLTENFHIQFTIGVENFSALRNVKSFRYSLSYWGVDSLTSIHQ